MFSLTLSLLKLIVELALLFATALVHSDHVATPFPQENETGSFQVAAVHLRLPAFLETARCGAARCVWGWAPEGR